MAILKHIASKNADYGESQRYLMFQYDEFTNKPILDENGELIPRDEFYIDGLNCDPFTYDMECKELNAQYHKNQKYDEIKSHHFILSFDPLDAVEKGLTGERAQQLGLEYARKNFPGHQALVCTHTDGNNESGNIHVHIVINSLRKFDVDRQHFMERPCDSRAGYKHHLTKDYLRSLKQSVMDMCDREHLNQVDLLSPAKKKITDKEYHAGRRGQKKMDERNRKMHSEGIIPRKTTFQTQKEFLRTAIEEVSSTACSLDEYQKLLLENYHIVLKIRRGRLSYLHPERNKPITGKHLGTHYEKDYLISLFEKNLISQKIESLPESPVSNFGIFTKSDLRLVIDLQHCLKAQQSQSYAMQVKLSNLQQMAKTIAYVQDHGYNTHDDLLAAFTETRTQTSDIRKSLHHTEQQLKDINEKIHYTGQYLTNKSIYKQYLNAKNKKKFRLEHPSEIALYETARKILKEHSIGSKLPSMKSLKAEKERLTLLKNSQYSSYKILNDCEKELKLICTNVALILNKDHPKQLEKDHNIS